MYSLRILLTENRTIFILFFMLPNSEYLNLINTKFQS